MRVGPKERGCGGWTSSQELALGGSLGGTGRSESLGRGRLRGGVNYGAELGRGTYPGGRDQGAGLAPGGALGAGPRTPLLCYLLVAVLSGPLTSPGSPSGFSPSSPAQSLARPLPGGGPGPAPSPPSTRSGAPGPLGGVPGMRRRRRAKTMLRS